MNRFSARVDINGQSTFVHVANTGRLRELLVPGAPVWVAAADRPGRRTAWDLALVEHGMELVSVDSRVPNQLVGRALELHSLALPLPYSGHRAEARVGASRFDFRLEGLLGPTLVEVKGVTLVVDGEARFPDAPTLRGARHLRELAAHAREGGGAVAIFLVQRGDALAFGPNRAADPAFAQALDEAAAAGVRILAFRCTVSTDGVILADELPVRL